MMKNKKSLRRDIVLILCLLTAGLLICLTVWLFSGKGGTVVVRVGGTVVGEYSLYETRTLTLQGTGGTNLLRIQNGQAWIEDADCPDGLCIRTGKISRQGQSIICLPHQLVVEVQGVTSGNEIDINVK